MKEFKKVTIEIQDTKYEGFPTTFESIKNEILGTYEKELPFVYDIRHEDGMMGNPATLEGNVYVNHWGYFICSEVIPQTLIKDWFHQFSDDEVAELIEAAEFNDSEWELESL